MNYQPGPPPPYLNLDEVPGNGWKVRRENAKALLDAHSRNVALLNVAQGSPHHGHVEARAKFVLVLINLEQARSEQ